MTAKTREQAVARNQAALDAMVKGDCSGDAALLSDRDDVTYGNPCGPIGRDRANVATTLASAAARLEEGAWKLVHRPAHQLSPYRSR